jgi:hypothetical protein
MENLIILQRPESIYLSKTSDPGLSLGPHQTHYLKMPTYIWTSYVKDAFRNFVTHSFRQLWTENKFAF